MFVVPEPLWLTLEDEKQFRCAGFVQSEIERYVEERSELIDNRREANGSSDEEEDDDDDEEDKDPKPSQKKSSQKGKKIRRDKEEDGSLHHLDVIPFFLNSISIPSLAFRSRDQRSGSRSRASLYLSHLFLCRRAQDGRP